MNRRQSLLALSTVSAHVLFPEVLARFGSASAAPAGAGAWRPEVLSAPQGELLAELVETIIPATETPGAKAARVHVFVDLVLAHCKTTSERAAFVKGLGAVASECRARYGAELAAAPEASRQELLQRLEAAGDAFVGTLKELTVLGYCTSEVGATQGLAYVAVPGDYQGCVDLKPGQKGWATS
jgi:Gluconate 2-dehydrogenase subunit 3